MNRHKSRREMATKNFKALESTTTKVGCRKTIRVVPFNVMSYSNSNENDTPH
jgi:hypothetical protein